jgi:membrane-bound serine protease (ClpP class)
MRYLLALLFLCLTCVFPARVLAADELRTPVAYIPIHGPIDDLKARYFQRAVDDAVKAGAATVVVHLTTDGGTLDGGRQMMLTALGVKRNAPMMVAFVDNRAYSAGSLIAFGHDRIYLTPQATLGDIGVIFQNKDGEIAYAPEKIETVVRTLLRSAAQNRGWNEAKLVKMTARNQELWRIDADKAPDWVLEDDLPRYLTAHHDLKRDGDGILRDGKRVGYIVQGKDRLISYTAKEAVDEGMATGLVTDLDTLYTTLGTTKSRVIDLSPSSTESVSWTLAAWAPLLAGLAVLFLVLEFKMPGGLFISLAAICGVAFFVCQFYQELAGALELILIILGIIALACELLVLPTGGLLAGLGALLIAIGLILSFMPDSGQFDMGGAGWLAALWNALRQSIFALGVMAGGAAVLIAIAPRLRAIRRISVETAIDAHTDLPAATLVGHRGVTRTGLSPSGFVTIDGQDLSASSEHGVFVAPGAAVEVIGTQLGEVVVRPVAT